MKYPLQLRFKILALAPQIYVADADGNEVLYVHQRLFKLKEKVNIYNNRQDKKVLYTLQADRIIDFSAKYMVRNAEGEELCAAKQYGWRSIWQTHFDILEGETVKFRLKETDPWVKIGDAALSFIPFLEILGGLIFHPSYHVVRVNADGSSGDIVMRLHKKRSFVERFFEIEKVDGALDDRSEAQALMSLLMMVLLERRRG